MYQNYAIAKMLPGALHLLLRTLIVIKTFVQMFCTLHVATTKYLQYAN